MTSLHKDSVERGSGSLRVVDRYLSLNFGQKIVVGLAAAVSVLLASYFASLLILSSPQSREGAPPQAGTPAPASSSASASAYSAPPARTGDKEGALGGREGRGRGVVAGRPFFGALRPTGGGSAGRALDWWDRSVTAETPFSARTFSQEFIRDEERNVKDHIDPGSDYWAVCWAQFSGGAATGNEAPVEGVPPG